MDLRLNISTTVQTAAMGQIPRSTERVLAWSIFGICQYRRRYRYRYYRPTDRGLIRTAMTDWHCLCSRADDRSWCSWWRYTCFLVTASVWLTHVFLFSCFVEFACILTNLHINVQWLSEASQFVLQSVALLRIVILIIITLIITVWYKGVISMRWYFGLTYVLVLCKGLMFASWSRALDRG